MGKATRASFIAIAALVGGALGAAVLGYAALAIGFLALSFARGGIHSDWSILALLAVVVGVGLGGLLGILAGVQFARFFLAKK
ncbi:hypothetical protein LQG66_32215 [Bradyrhizobium ontarionense]|uniref:Major facilitator superfamily (MFS) profile domain-containing protein n=1 Tax=Bradyrhizobium ontarionense TaxID=2898149 RepID=A0ABY3RAM9_9BRAD|nr:hypothetical protein [Bradyrhizobium sp. A19]UFZ03817.1 hypothetical protein LQG66_32215 [Bradyrhizobium sp. A19]